MRSSYVNQFERDIELEIQSLFEQICSQKVRIQSLIASFLSEEKELNDFVSHYEAYFQTIEARRAQIAQQMQVLENSKRRASIVGSDDFWHEWKTEPNESPSAEDNPLPEAEASLPLSGSMNVDLNALFEETSVAVIEDRAVTRQHSPKRIVAEPFQWIYHPRAHNMNTTFYRERSQLLNDLIGDARYDEVDILMRLPFDDHDRELWLLPLPKGGDSTESRGDRLYRLRLWNWLLEQAAPRAEAIAASMPHPLYPTYKTWKQRGIAVLPYFQELEDEKRREIEQLELRLTELQR